MPEYLAPGVYVEETSFRAKSIEGVSTTTTGFIGPTRYGPVNIEPEIITSLGEFERTYGDRGQLQFTKVDGATLQEPMHNYMWHAVRAFFEEGGKRLYIERVFRPINKDKDGYASAWLPNGSDKRSAIRVRARFPGAAGKMRVRFTLRISQNILGGKQNASTAGGLLDKDIVWIKDQASPLDPPASPPDMPKGNFYSAESNTDRSTGEQKWRFHSNVGELQSPLAPASPPADPIELSNLIPHSDPRWSDQVRVLNVTVSVISIDSGDVQVWDGLALDPNHTRAGEPDSLFAKFATHPSNRALARTLPIVIEREPNTLLNDGMSMLQALFSTDVELRAALDNTTSTDADRSVDVLIDGGNDGQRPTADDYEGTDNETDSFKTGLKSFEDIEDISIIAAPGSTAGYENGYGQDAASITNLLISHAERMRYRIAVLDAGDGQNIAQARAMRARLDSKYAAFYFPWIRILDPVTRREISVPPSGAVAGIYARNDIQRAVYKAPANEVVNTALGFELMLNKAQQEVLNPEGINCFRFFEGRGMRLWGARTISSDPEWKYVNLRRYFIYLERSIDRGTQWAVFEPNGEALWANVRRTIEDFLLNEWQMGALLGDKPEKAYFVKCDRTTMTQNDLDNGRLVCLIGVAPLRPAEFVIFRIGQWTGDRRV